EYAEDWSRAVTRWLDACEPLRQRHDGALAPHDGDLAMLFQMIVGAWPAELALDDDGGRKAFAERLADWQQKALPESQLATEWIVPDEPYEAAARAVLMGIVVERAAMLSEMVGFAQRIAPTGAVNGLAQALLRLTVPGVPDLYQGTEFWDFSLVDPENRRPVDFAERAAALEDGDLQAKYRRWRDGHIKQAVIARTLRLRAGNTGLFAE